MSAVEDEKRFPAQDFEARRPLYFSKAPPDILVCDCKSSAAQHFHCRQDDSRVVELIAAQKRKEERRLSRQILERLPLQRSLHRHDAISLCNMQTAVSLPAHRFHHVHDFRVVFIQDNVCTGLDDAGFGPGDCRESIPEVLRVLETDVCDHCCLRRIDHVRSVELASKAHFQHHDIAFCLVKIQHTDRRDQFKLARMVLHSVRFLSHPVCDLAQRLLGDIFSAHLNPLTEILDVG